MFTFIICCSIKYSQSKVDALTFSSCTYVSCDVPPGEKRSDE